MVIVLKVDMIFYYLLYDWDFKVIEEVLNCKLIPMNEWMLHGKYYPNYIEYLAVGNVDETKVRHLENETKKEVVIHYKNFNYYIRVYHKPLSPICNFESVKSKALVLGRNRDGLMTIPLTEQENNYLLVGASGSGKSCLARSIIKNLLYNKIDVWICDNKGSFDYSQFNLKIGKNTNDCLSMINDFEELVESRLKVNKKYEPLLFIIDEIFPLSCCDSKQKRKVMNQLALVMSRCRSANCHIMLITQRNTGDIIDTRLMANISNRICLKTSSKQESINALDCDIAHKIETVGRGYVSIDGKLEEFQSFYFENSKGDDGNENEKTDREGSQVLRVPSQNKTTSKFL